MILHLNILNMSVENSSFSGAAKGRLYREQILTTEDLREFKAELLDEIRKLIMQIHGEPSKKLIRSPEVRKLLNLPSRALQNLRVNGTLPYMKVEGVIFYDFEDIQKMLEESRTQNNHSLNLFHEQQ
jgi:heme oxygenase